SFRRRSRSRSPGPSSGRPTSASSSERSSESRKSCPRSSSSCCDRIWETRRLRGWRRRRPRSPPAGRIRMARAESDPRRQEAAADRRPPELQRIRRALFDLCAEIGYSKLDVSTLLERAGVSRRAFFGRFTDLEDCLCNVVEEERAELLSR